MGHSFSCCLTAAIFLPLLPRRRCRRRPSRTPQTSTVGPVVPFSFFERTDSNAFSAPSLPPTPFPPVSSTPSCPFPSSIFHLPSSIFHLHLHSSRPRPTLSKSPLLHSSNDIHVPKRCKYSFHHSNPSCCGDSAVLAVSVGLGWILMRGLVGDRVRVGVGD